FVPLWGSKPSNFANDYVCLFNAVRFLVAFLDEKYNEFVPFHIVAPLSLL
ncbi:unnamed protein product, partial [Allacma fusca]